jgi:hypothetical protein
VNATMSFLAKHELLERISARYRVGGRKQKRIILDEFIESTGYARKYAIRLLGEPGDPRAGIRRQRLRWYGSAVEEALMTVWNSANGICAKRLVPFIPELITALESHGHLSLSADTRSKLLTLSAATADRILRRSKAKVSGKSTTKRGKLLKHQVPIRTFADWQDSRPGFVEADLVAHCGDRVDGSFLNTLVLTDVATGWTECQALLCKSGEEVLRSLALARRLLPFPLLGLDTDNGSEFLNEGLLTYCKDEGITFTRGRAHKKNDQCFVEQKNGSIVRELVGYDRFEGLLAYRQLAELYRVIRLYVNYFQPSMKLVRKTREGAKVSKFYDAARTPYQRLAVSGALDPAIQAQMKGAYQILDPVELLRQMERLQDIFWQHAQAAVRSAVTHTDKAVTPQPAMQKPFDTGIHRSVLQTQFDVCPLPTALSTGGDQRSRRKYRRSERARAPRTWRTRKDPFDRVWTEVMHKLQLSPELTAKTIFNGLHEKYPNEFSPGQLRTLQRRVKEWRRQTLVTFTLSWPEDIGTGILTPPDEALVGIG